MPETGGETNPPCEQPKPKTDWIAVINAFFSGATTAILLVTMVYVIKYANEAHKQNVSLAKSIEQQAMINRPVIIGNGVGIVEKNSAGVPTKVRVVSANFGRSTAPMMTTAGHIFAINNGQPAPFDPECNEHGPWPNGNPLSALVPYQPPPSVNVMVPAPSIEGQRASAKTHKPEAETFAIPMQPVGTIGSDWDVAQEQTLDEVGKGKTLFVIGCIYYQGLDNTDYFSDVCVSWAGGDQFPVCPDRTRNFVH